MIKMPTKISIIVEIIKYEIKKPYRSTVRLLLVNNCKLSIEVQYIMYNAECVGSPKGVSIELNYFIQ